MLEIENISKNFGGTRALDKVSLAIEKGEIHALVGTNGSGKSTLIKIIMGVTDADEGRIIYRGEEVRINNPMMAQKIGIGAIYQEPTLIPHFTAVENICLGHEQIVNKFGQIDKHGQKKTVEEIIKRFGLNFPADEPVANLGVGQQRVVEVAKVLSLDCELILVDEATAGMPEEEINKFFEILRALRDQGITIIYISHYLENIFKLADKVSILRDGKYVGTEHVPDSSVKTIIPMMLGKNMEKSLYPEKPDAGGELNYEISGVSYGGLLKDIKFNIYKNEILGVAGLLGAGKTEIARTLYGLERGRCSGTIRTGERTINLRKSGINRNRGIVYLPEERKTHSIFSKISIKDNISLGNMKQLSGRITGQLKNNLIDQYCRKVTKDMQVKLDDINQDINELSGGNQQKVLIGKWIGGEFSILLLDEPTRGIDVGAKAEIYHKIREIASENKSVVVFSSEIEELVGLCDRIIVLYKGRLIKELSGDEITKDNVLFFSMGGEHA